mmetsp:Transcript_28222/g.39710  ORF Transcript_28222/g.39710 Transcript_28222/m.39710 type:complete len:328 (-) Transcript_28222:211-1194(-)
MKLSNMSKEEAKEKDTTTEEEKAGDKAGEASKEESKEEPKEEPKKESKEEESTEEKESKDDDEKDKTNGDGTQRPSKRARKSAEAFQPVDFTIRDIGVKIYNGRGVQLSQIEAIRENIDSYKDSSYEIAMAHKFLYSYRGKIPHKVKKGDILSFSGYLTPEEKGEDEDARERDDNDNEKKMSVKAFKLKLPEIKNLCDMFDVDRSKNPTKEDLIDRLLDFLGTPDEKLTKSFAKQKSKSEKISKKEPASTKKEKNEKKEKDSGKDGTIIKGKMPTDKQLRKWVQAYVRCFDLDKATTKHAIVTASDKFGTDLTSKKARIKEMLAEEM